MKELIEITNELIESMNDQPFSTLAILISKYLPSHEEKQALIKLLEPPSPTEETTPLQIESAEEMMFRIVKMVATELELDKVKDSPLWQAHLIAMEEYANQKENDGWVSIEDREPTIEDEQIVVTNGNGFFEIVYKNDSLEEFDDKYLKPHRFDKNDTAVFRDGNFKQWKPLPKKPL